jgi:hypothetical protein
MAPKKGQKSKTMRGEKDYSTKSSSRFYDRGGHRIMPYHQKRKDGGYAFLIPLASGLMSGGVSYGVQRGLKKLFGGTTHRKKKH